MAITVGRDILIPRPQPLPVVEISPGQIRRHVSCGFVSAVRSQPFVCISYLTSYAYASSKSPVCHHAIECCVRVGCMRNTCRVSGCSQRRRMRRWASDREPMLCISIKCAPWLSQSALRWSMTSSRRPRPRRSFQTPSTFIPSFANTAKLPRI